MCSSESAAVLHFALKPETTVCFDEPDNFIALGEALPWLTKVLDRTQEDEPAQALIASHHPELLNHMAFAEGLFCRQARWAPVPARRFDDPSQTGLGLGVDGAGGGERE